MRPPLLPIRKRFGQHFLTDPGVVDRIFSALALGGEDHVLEIGPGTGVLTERACRLAGAFAAIEVDRDLAAALRSRLELGELSPDLPDPAGEALQHHLVCADVLRVDLAKLTDRLAPCRVVGNLPYNIATVLLTRLLPLPGVKDIHVMLQAEVAARLTARPGTKAYGRLSVQAQHHCDVRRLFAVGAASFSPAPRVDSAFVRLVPKQTAPVDRAALDRVLVTAFAGRRKTLANALESIAPDWPALGIDPQRRPDTLAPEEFVAIAKQVRADGTGH